MLVVSDVQDMFMPLLDGFLVRVSEAEQVIDRQVKLNSSPSSLLFYYNIKVFKMYFLND